MAKIREMTVSRGFTIMNGYNADKPNFGITVELEDHEDWIEVLSETINQVNLGLIAISESSIDEE